MIAKCLPVLVGINAVLAILNLFLIVINLRNWRFFLLLIRVNQASLDRLMHAASEKNN